MSSGESPQPNADRAMPLRHSHFFSLSFVLSDITLTVKGVVLIGDPEHKAGLACNVDANGGSTTKNANGLSVFKGGVPANWVSRTLDICALVSSLSDFKEIFFFVTLFVSDSTRAFVRSLAFYLTGRRSLRHELRLWNYSRSLELRKFCVGSINGSQVHATGSPSLGDLNALFQSTVGLISLTKSKNHS